MCLTWPLSLSGFFLKYNSPFPLSPPPPPTHTHFHTHIHTPAHTGSVMATKLDNYISFHESLLGFYESFVVVYRVPVFSLLWPLLRQLEPQVTSVAMCKSSSYPILYNYSRKIYRPLHKFPHWGGKFLYYHHRPYKVYLLCSFKLPSKVSSQTALLSLRE